MQHKRNKHLTPIARPFQWLGLKFLRSTLGRLTSLFLHAAASLFSEKRNFKTDMRNIISQAYSYGIEVFPIMFFVAIVIGVFVILQTLTVISKVGLSDSVGSVMTIMIIRELGPIFTAFLIAGRSGSATTTYIGSMQINSEIDALSTMGVDPVRYLVMPALFGGCLATFIMNICFDVFSVGGGFFVAWLINTFSETFNLQFTWQFLSNAFISSVTSTDLMMVIVKPLLFGAIIVTNACYQGLNVQRDIRQLPPAVSRSVIYSFLYVVLANAVLAAFYIFDYVNEFSKII